MKKLSILLLPFILLSCDWTTNSQDAQMLQHRYKKVYMIDEGRYITIDTSSRVYDIRVTNNGNIRTIVEIR